MTPTDPNQQTAQPSTSSDAGQPSGEAVATQHRGLIGFARRHRALTIAGIAGVGLFGGIELAAGVLLGAGAAAFLRRGRAPGEPREQGEAPPAEAPSRMRQMLMERARAVVHAARGDAAPSH